jgi:hypothetical protein
MSKLFFRAAVLSSLAFCAPSIVAQTPASAPNPAPVSTPTAPRAKPCTSIEKHQFDFWIGDWDVTVANGKPAGTNFIKPILGGCVLHENWNGGGSVGQSFNAYDAERKVWHQTWVDGQGGLLLMEGRFENGVMTMSDRALPGKVDAKAINEIAWTPLEGGAVRQLWRTSADGGKTWTVLFDGKYVRAAREQPSGVGK